MMLNKQELNRYARHLALPDFGITAQEKLKKARVLVVGAGGLGSPVLLYLAAAGVGHIGIVDFDIVEESNLQRQVLYTLDDIGLPKAVTAKQRLLALNPHLNIQVFPVALQRENALEIISKYDIIADGTDNFPTRYLVNDACVLAGKINVYASIFRYEGQVSVFNFKQNGSRGANYRDLFPTPPPPNSVPNCAEGGVLGVLAGIIGTLQANEVIKIITGNGEPLAGKLYILDSASMMSRTLKIRQNPKLKITNLIDYQAFCGIKSSKENYKKVKLISKKTFLEWQNKNELFQLIDVREPYEYERNNLEGLLIPLRDILTRKAEIEQHQKVVIHCQSGQRSLQAIQLLQAEGFENLYNLEGGINAFQPT